MAEPISDRAVLRALCPFARATGPVLDALARSDPFDLRSRVRSGEEQLDRTLSDRVLDALAEARVPGTPAWDRMSVEQRCRWWVYRVGRFTTLLASVPGIGGALADRLPVQAALGAAAQGLVLCAIAREYGVRDEDHVVAMLGSVLFNRDLRPLLARAAAEPTPAPAAQPEAAAQPALAAQPEPAAQRDPAGEPAARPTDAEVESRAAELTGELAEPGKKPPLRRIGRVMWRLGRGLLALEGELDKRPHGRWYHQVLGALPVVGLVGDYLGEWSGLKRASRKGIAWLRDHPEPSTR
jgi:ribosomal protein L12E/L44/L45/RPP1/RPP2